MYALFAAALLGLADVTPAASPATIYVISYHAGPAWLVGKPLMEQPIGAHSAYMKQLFSEGRMIAAGPTLEAPGGMILLSCASVGEAKATMDADPAVTAGLFVGELRTWRVAFSNGESLASRRPEAAKP